MVVTHTPICDFGWKAPDFTLENVDGRRLSLADVAGERGTLMMFICNHCPYVKATLDLMIEDARNLAEIGVGTVAIMPNDTLTRPDDSLDNMRQLAADKGLPFPYLIDETQDVARAYGAVCTPDFFGFDKDLGLQYRGRITEVSEANPVPGAKRDLRAAMMQIAETGEGPRDQVPSMGCSIKWKP